MAVMFRPTPDTIAVALVERQRRSGKLVDRAASPALGARLF
jgi:hypothetical protein